MCWLAYFGGVASVIAVALVAAYLAPPFDM